MSTFRNILFWYTLLKWFVLKTLHAFLVPFPLRNIATLTKYIARKYKKAGKLETINWLCFHTQKTRIKCYLDFIDFFLTTILRISHLSVQHIGNVFLFKWHHLKNIFCFSDEFDSRPPSRVRGGGCLELRSLHTSASGGYSDLSIRTTGSRIQTYRHGNRKHAREVRLYSRGSGICRCVDEIPPNKL